MHHVFYQYKQIRCKKWHFRVKEDMPVEYTKSWMWSHYIVHPQDTSLGHLYIPTNENTTKQKNYESYNNMKYY